MCMERKWCLRNMAQHMCRLRRVELQQYWYKVGVKIFSWGLEDPGSTGARGIRNKRWEDGRWEEMLATYGSTEPIDNEESNKKWAAICPAEGRNVPGARLQGWGCYPDPRQTEPAGRKLPSQSFQEKTSLGLLSLPGKRCDSWQKPPEQGARCCPVAGDLRYQTRQVFALHRCLHCWLLFGLNHLQLCHGVHNHWAQKEGKV